MPTDLGYVYTSEADVRALLGQDGADGRLDDDGSGALSPAEAAHMAKAVQWASARVNFYLLGQYDAAGLAGSWVVSEWATVCACYWLSCRRGNPSPASIKDLYDAVVEDMKLVKSGEHTLPDVGMRSAGWPAWSNVRVDVTALGSKVRVQRSWSERRGGLPTGYVQPPDYSTEYIPPGL